MRLGHALLGLLVLGATSLLTAAAPAVTQPRYGGSVVIAGQVDCPNIWLVCSGEAAPAVSQVIEGAFKVGPDLTYRPNLISRAEVTPSPFSVTYFIRPNARWSDGVPVSASDFQFTYRVFTTQSYSAAPEAPLYAHIRRVRVLGPKTVRVEFSSRDAAWRDLFHTVFPQHALANEDLRQVWTDGIDNPRTGEPISDGPFLVSSFVPGDHLTIVRNAHYWGPHRAYLDSVVFRQAEDSVAAIDQLRTGQADAISPQIEPQLAELRTRPGLTVLTRAGTVFSHLAFRLGPGGSDLVRRPFVRQAIAYGIDRAALVHRLFSGLDPSLGPLENLIFVSTGRFFEPHWNVYRHDVARARGLLERHGCRPGTDGIEVCGGERLSLRLATTAGNPLRELTFSILRTQLLRVGIELVPVFAAPPVFFGQILKNGDFDISLFTWVNTPDPGYAVEIWRCNGSENLTGYCSSATTHDLEASNRVLDVASRAALLNRADARLAQDLPAIPLYQTPIVVAFKDTVHGIVVNPTDEGWTWNLKDWWVAR